MRPHLRYFNLMSTFIMRKWLFTKSEELKRDHSFGYPAKRTTVQVFFPCLSQGVEPFVEERSLSIIPRTSLKLLLKNIFVYNNLRAKLLLDFHLLSICSRWPKVLYDVNLLVLIHHLAPSGECLQR